MATKKLRKEAPASNKKAEPEKEVKDQLKSEEVKALPAKQVEPAEDKDLLQEDLGESSDVSGEEEGSDEGEYESSDDLGEDEAGSGSEGEGEEEEEGEGEDEDLSEDVGILAEYSGSDAADSDDGSEDQGAAEKRVSGKFSEGSKDASLARALTKILSKPVKGATAEAEAVPILAASKNLAKRRAEEHEDTEARRAAKRAKLERRMRGHVTVPTRGEDPTLDAQEKNLARLATRGVVLLFNAISQAQQQQQASGAKASTPKQEKASQLLAKLQNPTATAGTGTAPLSAGEAALQSLHAGGAQALRKKGKQGAAAAAAEASGSESGWKVLQEGFIGIGNAGSKMKTWDQEGAEGDVSDASCDELESGGGDSDRGDDGW